jgi:hypothetical protein
MRRLLIILVLACLAAGGATTAAAQVAPDERWLTLRTEHFDVHFTPELEVLARRAAGHAELARERLIATLSDPPGGRIHIVVSDASDVANGYASQLPRPRMVLLAHPPVDELRLSAHDEWLDLLVTHELAHLFHLDTAGGIWAALRTLFGRTPLSLPQRMTPWWWIEGAATYYETRLTPGGRVGSPYFDMVMRTAALEGTFLGLDRVTGDAITWPGPAARYIYGGYFLDYLASRHGDDAVAALTEVIARHPLPFRMDAAGRRALGTPLHAAWGEWQREMEVAARATADSLRALGVSEPEVLTTEGWWVRHPRFSPDGGSLVYAASTGRDAPRLVRLDLATGDASTLAPVNSLGAGGWREDGYLWGQLEMTDPYRMRGDLYLATQGGVRRLTAGARLLSPDPHPLDGRIAAIRGGEGTTVPVILDAEGREVRALAEPSADVQWASPRWSPAGDRIALVRWHRGGRYEVVVMDAESGEVEVLTGANAFHDSPAWSPDGAYLVFLSDRSGTPDLFAHRFADGALLQVTRLLTGAGEPDVSPDGRWIAFPLYGADGYRLARLPFDPAGWPEADAPLKLGHGHPVVAPAGGEAEPYRSLRTLAPTGWQPVLAEDAGVGWGLGLMVQGSDVIDRHIYQLSGHLRPVEMRADLSSSYRYRGLGTPLLDLSAGQRWRLAASSDALPSDILRRERRLDAGAVYPIPRMRRHVSLAAGASLLERTDLWRDPAAAEAAGVRLRETPLDAGAVLSAGYSSARRFAFSVSPEQGVTLSGSVQGRRYLRPFEGEETVRGYTRLSTRARGYVPFDLGAFARQVVAVQGGAAADLGSRAPGFEIGGNLGEPVPFLPGTPELGVAHPIRGYRPGTQLGDRVLSGSAEVRLPLRLVERGWRAAPAFLDRTWGALFADAGAAWCASECLLPGWTPDRPDPIASVGAELAASFSLGFHARYQIRGGLALPLRPIDTGDGEHTRPSPSLYLRLGPSF